jgi:hypothetical protein
VMLLLAVHACLLAIDTVLSMYVQCIYVQSGKAGDTHSASGADMAYQGLARKSESLASAIAAKRNYCTTAANGGTLQVHCTAICNNALLAVSLYRML